MNKISSLAIRWGVPVAIALAGIAYARYAPRETVYQPGPTSTRYIHVPKTVERVKRELVPVTARIEIFDKAKVAEALKMPELKDVPGMVVAAGEVPPSLGKTSVAAILSPTEDNVLKGSLLTRAMPPPFFQIKKKFSAEVGYDFVGRDSMSAALVANPLRVGPVQLKAKGGVVMDRETGQVHGKAGIYGEWEF